MDIALVMADASKESEDRRALKRYMMVKAVLIQPVRGGGNHRNRNVNMTERLMYSFYKGKEDEVWEIAMDIEDSRQKKTVPQQEKRTKRSLHGDVIKRKSNTSEVKRRSERAKRLTNDGELSKAFATMFQRGVAPSTNEIITQLQTKFPTRGRAVKWPDKDRIDDLRKLVEKVTIEMNIDEHMDKEPDPLTLDSGGLLSDSFR